MERKKSWFGTIFLILAAALTAMILSVGLGGAGTFYLYGYYKKFLTVFTALILLGAAWLGAGVLARSGFPDFSRADEKRLRILSALAVAVLVAGIAALQIYNIYHLYSTGMLRADIFESSAYHRAASALLNGSRSGEAADVNVMLPGIYGYGKVLSLLYILTGLFPMAAILFGKFFFLLNLFLIYFAGKRMLGRGAGLIALGVYGFWPSNTSLMAGPDSAELGFPAFYTCILLAGVLCFLIAGENGAEQSRKKTILFTVLAGLLTGYACFVNPVFLLAPLFMTAWYLLGKRWKKAALFAVLATVLFIVLQYGKAVDLGKSAPEVFGAYWEASSFTVSGENAGFYGYLDLRAFQFEQAWGRDVFSAYVIDHFDAATQSLKDYGNPWVNQMLHMLLVAFAFFSYILAWRRKQSGAFLPVTAVTGGILLLSGFCLYGEADAVPFYALFALAGGCGIQMLYEDLKIKKEQEDREEEQEIRVIEEKAEKADQARKEEEKGIRFIKNPLPVPKKHVPKVMDFDITEVEKQEYDVEVPEGDDYDQ